MTPPVFIPLSLNLGLGQDGLFGLDLVFDLLILKKAREKKGRHDTRAFGIEHCLTNGNGDRCSVQDL